MRTLPALAACLICTPSFAAGPITSLGFSPNGKTLAAGGYSTVTLVSPELGNPTGSLGGLTQAVTAVSYAPDGRVLVAAYGKPGEVGELRFFPTAGEPRTVEAHADLIHAIDFSPDGNLLATAGYDRVIKLWDVAAGELVRELTDHSDAVYGLAFSPDGKLLASCSADRAVKVWDVSTGRRLYTLGDATDWVYAVAWSPDGKRLAAGGVDRSVRVWRAGPDGGELEKSAFAHAGAVTALSFSPDGKVLYSLGEDRVVKRWDFTSLSETKAFPAQAEAVHAMALSQDGKLLALGQHDGACVLLDAETGEQKAKPLPTRFPVVAERGSLDSPRTGQTLTIPATVAGAIHPAGDVDFFRFTASEGQEVGVRVESKGDLAPLVEVIAPSGEVIAETESGHLGFVCRQAGEYAVGIRDRDYRGGEAMGYALDIGPIPVVTGVHPLGAKAGTERQFRLTGVNLGDGRNVNFRIPEDAVPGSRHKLPLSEGVVGEAWVHAGRTADGSASPTLTAPVTVDGVIAEPGQSNEWQFTATAGKPVVVEVAARRYGSPMDPYVEILHADGTPVMRATLRCVARTFMVFRDADSKRDGIRIEAWNELAVNDLMYLDGELIKIFALPKNPDDDCRFYHIDGQRQSYLGTTSSYHSNGTPMYQVEVHPPGASFPPNGMPVFRLPWRNDDGGPNYGQDAALIFEPPANGEYLIRVGDTRGEGGERFSYRLTVRDPEPDYSVSFNPKSPAVWKRNGLPITVKVNRRDGFDGPVRVALANVPAGWVSEPSWIEAGHALTELTLFAPADAELPKGKVPPLILTAEADIGGVQSVREVTGGVPKLVNPGDLVTSTDRSEVTLKPGGTAKLTVKIERRNKFNGRVPLDLLGLPHGVRVLDIGLNGILILPGQTERQVTIYADPWVEPMERPVVVLSQREGKNTQHAAQPVTLRVVED